MKDGKLHTSSRGGGDYDIAAFYILTDAFIKSLFNKDPNLVLDGELYIHGKPLNYISGLCRLEELKPEHGQLKFYCYDIIDETQTFEQRLEYLEGIVPSWNSLLVMVDHVKVNNHDEIMKLHDEYVNKGYEGLVLRDPTAKYKCGSRAYMQKVKIFTDSEFKILGLVEGLREEDMCFLMETKEGYEFKAKPIGTREDKQYYRDHINDMIGKMATVKYFGMTNTDKPVPNLPV